MCVKRVCRQGRNISALQVACEILPPAFCLSNRSESAKTLQVSESYESREIKVNDVVAKEWSADARSEKHDYEGFPESCLSQSGERAVNQTTRERADRG